MRNRIFHFPLRRIEGKSRRLIYRFMGLEAQMGGHPGESGRVRAHRLREIVEASRGCPEMGGDVREGHMAQVTCGIVDGQI